MSPSPYVASREMRAHFASRLVERSTPNQAPYLTPYLGLRSRLSQIWINRWTVLLLLVLVRVLFAIAGTDQNLSSARREALSACTSVERVGSSMASMPYYMSQGVNELTANGIERAVNGLMSMVTMTLTGVEELVVFIIGLMTNTYLCLVTLLVSGSLHYAIDLLNNAQDDLNKALQSIGSDIKSAASDVQKGLNGLVSGINTFTGSKLPTIDFSKQVNALNDYKLPDSLNDNLAKLNKSIPDFAQVKNVTETVIRFPFEELKKVVSKELGTYTFNRTIFPVPQKQALTFCSENNDINNFFDGLVKVEHDMKNIFIGVTVTLAILICIPMAWWEIKRWRSLQERSKLIGAQATDPMDAVYMASRPYTSRIGWAAANRFSSPRRQVIARWAVAYATSVPALFILSLALAGLFSCLCQYIILKSIEKEVPALTGQVANFTGKVVQQLNNASTMWARDTNAVILGESQKLNKDLLGWVNTSTVAVNNTLNKFVDETTNLLQQTFGDTPLYEPVKGIFNCLIEIKIQGIQKGLTWVHDKAQINFPTLPNDTFTLDAVAKMTKSDEASSFLANPSSAASDDISGALKRVTDAIAKAIHQEAVISTMILVCWLILCFIGLFRALFLLGGREKVRGEAGHDYNSPPSPLEAVPHLEPPRPQSAAPPSYVADPDVNKHAPYTLNPHPFPRRSQDEESQDDKISESRDGWSYGRSLTGQAGHQRRDEKTGFSDEKTGGFI